MSKIIVSPENVLVNQDPALQYISTNEKQTVLGSLSSTSNGSTYQSTSGSAIIENVTNNITKNIIYNRVNERVLDLTGINIRPTLTLSIKDLEADIITANPTGQYRSIVIPSASSAEGQRITFVNRNDTHHLIIKNPDTTTIVVVEAAHNVMIISDGYNWVEID